MVKSFCTMRLYERRGGLLFPRLAIRSQQPGPDRFQDLLQRQTRSFFCLKVDGQDEQVCERAQGKVMMKATLGSSLKVIKSIQYTHPGLLDNFLSYG